MFFVNGKEQQSVALSDRSFQYGDGCFTTMLVQKGLPMHLAAHKERLQKTCQRLAIDLPAWSQIQNWIDTAIQESGLYTKPLSGLKVHISRGQGGRGYSALGIQNSQVTIHLFEFPAHYAEWQQSGVKVGVSKIRLGLNPLLAGLKHNNRLEQVLIKQDIEKQNFCDCIVLDCHDKVIEMCAANIFWVKDGSVYTADLTQSGVTGVMRGQVIDSLLQNRTNVTAGLYSLDELFAADEVFMTNAIHGVVPIIQIKNTTFTIGAMTRALQEKFNP